MSLLPAGSLLFWGARGASYFRKGRRYFRREVATFGIYKWPQFLTSLSGAGSVLRENGSSKNGYKLLFLDSVVGLIIFTPVCRTAINAGNFFHSLKTLQRRYLARSVKEKQKNGKQSWRFVVQNVYLSS